MEERPLKCNRTGRCAPQKIGIKGQNRLDKGGTQLNSKHQLVLHVPEMETPKTWNPVAASLPLSPSASLDFDKKARGRFANRLVVHLRALLNSEYTYRG